MLPLPEKSERVTRQFIPQYSCSLFVAVPAIQPTPHAPGSLRDQMLKQPDSNKSSSIQDGQNPDTQLQIPSSDSSKIHPDLPGDGNNPDTWLNSIVSISQCHIYQVIFRCCDVRKVGSIEKSQGESLIKCERVKLDKPWITLWFFVYNL